MQSTSLHKPPTLPRLLAVVFVLALLLMMTGVSRATSCSTISLTSKPVTCTIPEQTPELTLAATLTGLSFTAQAQGMVLIYDDAAHTILSDVVTFTNVGGIATVAFFSDTDGIPVTAQGLPILGQFTESNKPVSLSVALLNGQFVNAKICSDLAESPSCSGSSDSITLSASKTTVPEPGTFILLGSGLLGSGILKYYPGALRRRLLNRNGR
jgi:PEP-CTERM motif-containing protein